MKRRFAILFGAWGVLGAPAPGAAQSPEGTPIEVGRSYQIESKVLGEARTIDVSLPRGYDTNPTQRYPVLVVLDREFEHGIAVAIARFTRWLRSFHP